MATIKRKLHDSGEEVLLQLTERLTHRIAFRLDISKSMSAYNVLVALTKGKAVSTDVATYTLYGADVSAADIAGIDSIAVW